MSPFLQAVAQDLYHRSGDDLSRTAVIFPGKRAGLWMDRYLAECAGHPLWAPAYMTISELFDSLTPLKAENPIRLICMLHRIYCEHTHSTEALDDFYHWGELMLSDFDDIDKNLVDAQKLFVNLADTRELESSFEFLTQDQKDLLSRFFANFRDTKEKTELKERFIELWQVMGNIYHDLRHTLLEQESAYEGMLQRHAISNFDPSKLTYDRYIIVGFNVLNRVEQALFDHLRDSGRALFYWDYDNHYYDNHRHEAGLFVRENIKRYGNALKGADIYDNLRHLSGITTISAPTDNAQARYLHQWLTEHHTRECEQDTAMVLCNEDIALPVLHALPHDVVTNVNVTMGFKLTQTPVYSHINTYLNLHTKGYDADNQLYTLEHTVQMLTHPYTVALYPEAPQYASSLQKANRIYLPASDLAELPLMGYLFVHPADNTALLVAITHLTTQLRSLFAEDEPTDPKSTEAAQTPYTQLNREALFRIYQIAENLRALTSDGTLKLRTATMARLLQRVMKSTSIPFHGEPAIGLQVMGLLETRNLDFRNLIILSANEGKLPKAANESSYIPYNLREAFGMNTLSRQNAVYAYYMYRLIQRAEHVTILYNDGTDGMTKQEPTRYLMQLQVEYPGHIESYSLQSPTQPLQHTPISVPQTDYTRRKLQQHFAYTPGKVRPHRLSPSAINDYLNCRLSFYLKHIEGLNPPFENSSEVDNALFGTLFHKCAELAYNKLTQRGDLIERSDLDALRSDERAINNLVDQAFREDFFHTPKDEPLPYNGTQLIVHRVLCKYLKQLLAIDAHRAPFTYIESEKQVHYPLTINSHGTRMDILLGGTVDRIDAKDGITRIIDYKTGGSQKTINAISELFDSNAARDAYVFQAFYYAHLLQREYTRIAPSLLFVRQTSNTDFEPDITINQVKVTDYSRYSQEFAELLTRTIDEIFNSDVPYTPTTNKDACKYCRFTALCRKKATK
ncbi:MAG: PD-(D/E)XK nuclease family protein [Bacteroidaceae bacterium]|nr:PD-(D/E)XK nuclease family protein [Bacteroidaceae bacterium]